MKPTRRLVLAVALGGVLAWTFSEWLRPDVLDFVAGLAFCGPAR